MERQLLQLPAFPAILAFCPSTSLYWWQDQATQSLVYPASQTQVDALIKHRDFSCIPHFCFDPVAGLIHEVRLETILAYKHRYNLPPYVGSIEQSVHPVAVNQVQMLVPSASNATANPDINQLEQLRKEVERLKEELANAAKEQKGIAQTAAASTVSSNAAMQEQLDVKQKQLNKAGRQEQLPVNWKMAMDSDGEPYYYHEMTRRTQWDFPTAEDTVREAKFLARLTSEQRKSMANS